MHNRQLSSPPRAVPRRLPMKTMGVLTALLVGIFALPATSSASKVAAAAKGKGSIVFIAGVKSSGFYQAIACTAGKEARALGYSFSWTAPDTFNAAQETPIVEAVTAEHPTGALVVPTDAVAMIAPIKQMQAHGIKVVLVDTIVNDPSVGLSRVATDNVAFGREAADALAKLIGYKGVVFDENDKPGASATDQRAKGFNAEIKKYPHITNLGVQYYKDNTALAASIVTSELAAHPKLAGVYSEDYRATEGIATGLRLAKAVGKVKVVGSDADPNDLKALRDGDVQALIVQKPTLIGTLAMEQLNNAITGRPVTKIVATTTVIATKANMNNHAISQFFYHGC
jgi:ribose transport system substrate-binding protein